MGYVNNFYNVNGFTAMSGFGNMFVCDSAIGDDKEIVFPEGYDNDTNLQFKVIFKNGHETVTDVNMTLNDTQGNRIPIVVNKYGNLIPLPTHDMDDGEGGVIYKSIQPNTILEMYYTSDYDGDNNPAYVIIGNPIVLSSETYTIYANGREKEKDIIAFSHPIGDLILTDIELTPKSYDDSIGDDYCPVIPRHDADHDIDTTVVPQSIIDKFNAVKWAFNGQKDFSCTVSGNSVVVENTTEGNALVSALVEQGMVNRWYDTGEDPNYASQGALYLGKRSFCLTIATVDYEITGVDALTNTITVGENPGDGVKTMSVYPHRIAGVNGSRLRKLSDESLSVAGTLPASAHQTSGLPNIVGYTNCALQMEATTLTYTGAFYKGTNPKGARAANLDAGRYPGLGFDASRSNSIYGKSNWVTPDNHRCYVYTHLRYLLSTNWTNN